MNEIGVFVGVFIGLILVVNLLSALGGVRNKRPKQKAKVKKS